MNVVCDFAECWGKDVVGDSTEEHLRFVGVENVDKQFMLFKCELSDVSSYFSLDAGHYYLY